MNIGSSGRQDNSVSGQSGLKESKDAENNDAESSAADNDSSVV